MRRQKPGSTVDLTFEGDVAGGAFAGAVRDEENTSITNETGPLDGAIATANGESSDEDARVIAIQLQAYALYRSRGERHGDDLADWLEAERMVRRLTS